MKDQIKRRNFLKGISSLSLLPLIGSRAYTGNISSIPVLSGQYNDHELRISRMEFIRLSSDSGKRSIYIKAETNGGIQGIYGPIDADAALLADKLLINKVLGRNALEHEAIWNQLFDSNRNSRDSHYLMGMSAIDNVLWDLKGRIFGQPVCKLLGGDRKQVRVCGSCLGFSQEHGEMQAKARELKAEGYTHQKWFMSHTNPQEGPAILKENVEKVKLLREALGDDADLMIDVLFKWDLP